MDSLIVAVAQYLPFGVPVRGGGDLALPATPGQGRVGVQAIMALVVAVVLVSLTVGSTTATWTWARPRLPRRLAELAFA